MSGFGDHDKVDWEALLHPLTGVLVHPFFENIECSECGAELERVWDQDHYHCRSCGIDL